MEADVKLLDKSLQDISHRAATRIQLLWRAQISALVFLDRCSEARFSARPLACDRAARSVLRRFSYPTSVGTSQVVVFSCVSSVVRSIVRTLEVARIIPLATRQFGFATTTDPDIDEQSNAARCVQKIYRGHLDRWICEAMRAEVRDALEGSHRIHEGKYDELSLQQSETANETERSMALGRIVAKLDEVPVTAEVSRSMLNACLCLQRCWRGCAWRRYTLSSTGFDVKRHRLAMSNLKIAIHERHQHDAYVGALSAENPVAEGANEQLDDFSPKAAMDVQLGASFALDLNRSLPVASVQPQVPDANVVPVTKSAGSEPLALSHQESEIKSIDLKLGAACLEKHCNELSTSASILSIQRLARRWLGRRSIRARRLILWRVRLIVQAAPAALRIQAVFRGHVGRTAYKTLWKWTNDPDPDQRDYTGIPTHFALAQAATCDDSATVKLSAVEVSEHLTIGAHGIDDGVPGLDSHVISILRAIYGDPETKNYLVRLMVDAPLAVPSVACRLPLHMLWKHGDDGLDIPWIQVHVVPPHLQPCVPADMKAGIHVFSSDCRIPAEDDPLLVSNPLAAIAKQLSCPYESVQEGFSTGTFPQFVQMVEGRGKIVRSSMGIECVQALMMDLGMIRALLSCAHTCLESFRYLRTQKMPLKHWESMAGLNQNQSDSWMWLSTNASIMKWCLCQDDASLAHRVSEHQISFADVADSMLKRCKHCLDMSLFFLRNSCNQFPPSCSWVRAWYFSLRGLWYVTNGKQLSALLQMQEGFIELICSHMRHATLVLESSAAPKIASCLERTTPSKRVENALEKGAISMSDSHKSSLVRPHSAASTVRPQSAAMSTNSNQRRSSTRPISAASSFM